MSEIQQIIDIANAEVGYLEKSKNAYLKDPTILYDKTKGAGSDNYTKYAKEMDSLKVYNGPKQGYAWCNVFIDWCFVQSVGLDRARELLIGFSAGCTQDWNWFKSKGQIVSNPQKGDLVFFGDCDHMGIVENVDGSKIYTIEGNTSNKAELVTNGGAVAKKSYLKTSRYIKGYARPKYKEETNNKPNTQPIHNTYTYIDFVKDIQRAEGQTGKWIDGIAGSKTLALTPTISRYKNRTNPCVKPVQKYLYALGYTEVGNADGDAGEKFEKAVKHFQKDNGCVQDGEITARNKTWKALLKI